MIFFPFVRFIFQRFNAHSHRCTDHEVNEKLNWISFGSISNVTRLVRMVAQSSEMQLTFILKKFGLRNGKWEMKMWKGYNKKCEESSPKRNVIGNGSTRIGRTMIFDLWSVICDLCESPKTGEIINWLKICRIITRKVCLLFFFVCYPPLIAS